MQNKITHYYLYVNEASSYTLLLWNISSKNVNRDCTENDHEFMQVKCILQLQLVIN